MRQLNARCLILGLLCTSCASEYHLDQAGIGDYGAMATFAPTLPSEPLGPEHGLRFEWQLTKLQLDSLIVEGAQWCFPAAVLQAQTKQNRIAHELESKLLIDAANDLIILRKHLAALEQQLNYVKNQADCAPPNAQWLADEMAVIKKLVSLFNVENQFIANSVEIEPTYLRNLADAAFILRDYPHLTLLVTGHADKQADTEGGQQLAIQRAEQVARYLVILGLLPARIQTDSVEDTIRLDAEANLSAKPSNRRVSIDVIAKTDSGGQYE